MNFEEHAAKPLLAVAGVAVPDGRMVTDAAAAEAVARAIGPCVVKAQVPTGKRGKAGGIKLAATPAEARAAAEAILGMDIGGHRVERLLVEAQVDIARELYVAVMNDAVTKSPLILFSPQGGMDIEDIVERFPEKMLRITVDIRRGADVDEIRTALADFSIGEEAGAIADLLARLYRVYADNDAELVEVNPLAVTGAGGLIALDCKFTLDDSAAPRHDELAQAAAPEKLTALEARAAGLGLKYVELGGDVGVLANGAGLTMTTMDVIRVHGGQPANFLEMGGEAYTKGRDALSLVLDNPKVKSLLVNFCGAFARTDVMAEGLLNAWTELNPTLPVFFTIHGTGEEEAVAMVRERLGIEPYDLLDDAVKAAVTAAAESGR